MADDRGAWYRALFEIATLGLVFPIAIGLGYFLGRWLDRTFGIYPWLTIAFTLFGIMAAFVNLFRASARLSPDGNGQSSRSGTDADDHR